MPLVIFDVPENLKMLLLITLSYNTTVREETNSKINFDIKLSLFI